MKDPRRTCKGHHLYPLEEILFLCISAVVSGMDDWTSISLFGRSKLEWLRQYLPYKRGIPSHDVLGKVFAALDPTEFSQCFSAWINSIAELTGGQTRGSDDPENLPCMSYPLMQPETASAWGRRL